MAAILYGGYLGFPIETILAIFNLQITQKLLIKVRVNFPFGSGREKKKNDFQDGGHLGFPIGTI